jgi:hypothetical protein
VKAGQYQPLTLPPLTRSDVTEATTGTQWSREPTGFNRWMEERYSDKVPEIVLNPVGEPQRLLVANTPELQGIVLTGKTPARHGTIKWGGREKDLQIRALDPMFFGTEDTIVRDRLWTARMNQAQILQMEADREYEATKDTVMAWCKARIEANREFLLDAAAKGSLVLPDIRWRSECGEGFPERDRRVKDNAEALRQAEGRSFWSAFRDYAGYGLSWKLSGAYLLGEMDSRNSRCMCAENPADKATVFTFIEAYCAQGLPVIFGVTFEELPWQLQHWATREPYVGNPILNRIDPQDWVLKNPWMQLNFRVAIGQSKKAYKARRQKLGLPRKVWAQKPETP